MRERDLFLEALDQPTTADRARFLERVAAEQPSLGERLRSLLREHEQLETGRLPAPPARSGPTSPAPTVGDLLGRPGARYKLLQKLGEGGMGTVWAADQVEPVQRRVAVKVIRDGADLHAVGPRFDQEQQALAVMDHPNIARVFDAGTADTGWPYFVMELVKGYPLIDYADAGELPLDERIALMLPVCRAVQHAHQKGVIHRDLKPSNVLVGHYDGKPVPKVIDFGIAKAAGPRLTDRTIFTRVGAVVGTPQYMAPEQAELDNIDVDTRADVYSLGVLLYELITGTTPLGSSREGGLLNLLREVRETEPDTPSARIQTSRELPALAARRRAEPGRLAGRVRGELDWIVMRCLEKDRNRRYQTAEELAADLENHLAGRPVLAGPPSRRYRAGKFLRNNRGWVAASAAIVLTLIATTAVSVALMVRAVRAESVARGESRRAEAERQAQEQEAAIARAVVAFLQDVLSQTNPVRQGDNGTRRDPDLTVRAALDRAAGRLDRAFPGQPLTEAAVRFTLGNAYQSIGRFPDARPHLERALELRASGLGDDHPETLAARQLLATLLAETGDHPRAERLLRQILGQLPPDDSAHRRTTRHALANVLETAGRDEDAAAIYHDLIPEYRASVGASHGLTLACQARLADIELKLGRVAPAEAGLREVLAAARGLGDDHPLRLATAASLASLLRQAGRPLEAEGLARETTRLCAERLGPTHPHTLASRANLAAIHDDLGRHDLSESEFRDVAARAEAALGPDHETTLTARFNLADILGRRGRGHEAEPILGEVLSRRASTLGENHPATLSARLGLAGLYFARKEYARAEPLYRVVIAVGRASDPNHLRALNNLAILYRRTDRHELADPLLRDAYNLALGRMGPGHPTTETCFQNLISAREHRGQDAEAEQITLDRLAAPPPAPRIPASAAADLHAILGRLRIRLRKPGEAEASLRQALDLYQQAGRTDWRVAYARAQLGWALHLQGRDREATPFLERGHLQMMDAAATLPATDRIPLIEQAAARRARNLLQVGRWDAAVATLQALGRWTEAAAQGAQP